MTLPSPSTMSSSPGQVWPASLAAYRAVSEPSGHSHSVLVVAPIVVLEYWPQPFRSAYMAIDFSTPALQIAPSYGFVSSNFP